MTSRRRLLALGWTLAIVVALSIPGESLPDVPVLGFDKLVHMTIFTVFAWLWMEALDAPLRARTWSVLAAGLLFAALSEVYQGALIPGRIGDVYDAVANALGLGAGVLVFRLRRPRRKTPVS
ncbi:VanZ family protein [Rhodocaloribacter sp.]